jgi:hypothetical protein
MLQTLLLPLEQFRNYCGLAFTAIAKLLDGLQTAVCQAGELRYCLRLPQVDGLLLMDSGGFQQKR